MQAPLERIDLEFSVLFQDQDATDPDLWLSQLLLTLYFAWSTWIQMLSFLERTHQASLARHA